MVVFLPLVWTLMGMNRPRQHFHKPSRLRSICMAKSKMPLGSHSHSRSHPSPRPSNLVWTAESDGCHFSQDIVILNCERLSRKKAIRGNDTKHMVYVSGGNLSYAMHAPSIGTTSAIPVNKSGDSEHMVRACQPPRQSRQQLFIGTSYSTCFWRTGESKVSSNDCCTSINHHLLPHI
jgi:hypothetical protein